MGKTLSVADSYFLFVHDHKFRKIGTSFYSPGGLPNKVWNRYTSVLGRIVVIGRLIEEKVVNDIKNFFDEKILKKTYNDFIKSLEKQLKPDTSKISIIEKTIKQKEKDITSLVKTLTTMATSGNEIATKAIANELEKITKEKEKLESELNDIKQPDLIKIPSFNEFQNQSLITKALLSPGDISKKRKIIWMFVKSIILDPKEKAVTVEYYENPLKMLLEKETKTANSIHNKKGSLIKTSNELVAGIGFEPMTFGL